MSSKTQDRTATGCLALFALPFAAVGVVALYFAGATLLDWQRMASWVPVAATLDTLALEDHQDDESTTHKVAASYRYSYGGRDYASTRVAISTLADNIGNFQSNLYSKLSVDRQRGAVTAFVDPDEPSHATLDRTLRPFLLMFQSVFALVFGGVGFGLLFGARYGARKLAAANELQRRFPTEPWRWREEWANGRVKASTRVTAYFAAGFALLWNLISLPAVFLVPKELAAGNSLVLVALLFPLIGIGLAVWAVRAWLTVKRFGTSTLVLHRTPIALGGRLVGAIRVETSVPVERAFRVELSCIEHRRSSQRDSDSSERIVWQNEWTVPRSGCQITPTYSSIPIDVPVPADQPAASPIDDPNRITWRLDISGECPGPDYWSRFELPVFATSETPSPAEVAAAPPSPASRPDRAKLESLGIRYEQLTRGGEAWTFGRARHKKVAVGLTLFCAMWTAFVVGMLWLDAPVLFPIVFGLFDALFIWFVLDLWLTEHRVTLGDGMLTVARRGLFGRAPVEIPRAMLRGIAAKRGMQAGNKLYYDVRVETDERTLTAASALPDYDVATWLAGYWMNGGSRPARPA
ncbi:MAG TPA: DUF3592 domain-containing protein [Gammaproteobacteria bacterium]|nr:DUF3592 domain-containing protein [Gammaproteobacteria bacterium]